MRERRQCRTTLICRIESLLLPDDSVSKVGLKRYLQVNTYLEDEYFGILFRQLLNNFVHLLARFCPWCPKVDE